MGCMAAGPSPSDCCSVTFRQISIRTSFPIFHSVQAQAVEIDQLMVRVIRELHFPRSLRKKFFKGYDAMIDGQTLC